MGADDVAPSKSIPSRRGTNAEATAEIGPSLARCVRELPAVHATGQANIGDQEVYESAGFKNLETRAAVAGFQHRVTKVGEHVGDDHAYGRLVLDHQHDGTSLRRQTRRRVNLCLAVHRSEMPGEVDRNRRALPNPASQMNVAARLLNEAIDHRQAEAGALAERLGREEGIKGARHCRRRHARAGVGNG